MQFTIRYNTANCVLLKSLIKNEFKSYLNAVKVCQMCVVTKVYASQTKDRD